ncbi:MAG: 2-oxoacid:acceptor oxidoreductase family protein [Bacillota bacterium]
MKKKEVSFSGYGGQGVVILSIMYANALSAEGFNVLQTQSYGIEARGGASKGELIYSKDEVNYLEIDRPDLLIMMSEEAFDKFSNTVRDKGISVLDSSNIPLSQIESYRLDNPSLVIYSHPFTGMSVEKFESSLFTNVIVLGFICSFCKDVSIENLKGSIKKYIKPEFIEKNIIALELGYSLPH